MQPKEGAPCVVSGSANCALLSDRRAKIQSVNFAGSLNPEEECWQGVGIVLFQRISIPLLQRDFWFETPHPETAQLTKMSNSRGHLKRRRKVRLSKNY